MLTLNLTADMSGVTDLVPQDTEENSFWYTFKVQCTSCREVHPNWVGVNSPRTILAGVVEKQTSFGAASPRQSTATIKNAPIPYKHESPPTRQKIIEFDCRGLEFTDFKPEGDWLATGTESNTKFKVVDLQDGEWYDYDEKQGEEVSIKDLKWEIRKA